MFSVLKWKATAAINHGTRTAWKDPNIGAVAVSEFPKIR